MGLHWNELARLEGAVLRKYERLVEQAHGAQAGSSAALTRLAFEAAWMDDPARVTAEAEAEEPAKVRRKPRLVTPEPKDDEEAL
ncbi:MAG TPA: hypothetical protein VF901_21910 [Bradyrhizobium sp.]